MMDDTRTPVRTDAIILSQPVRSTVRNREGEFSKLPLVCSHVREWIGGAEAPAETPFRERRFLLVPSEIECCSEDHSDPHSEADIIHRDSSADTENEADANTLLDSLSF